MANFSLGTINKYSRKRTDTASGRSWGNTALEARTTALNDAGNATLTAGSWSNTSAPSSQRLGTLRDARTTSHGAAIKSDLYYDMDAYYCDWSASQDVYQYELYIPFTIPSGLTANKLGSATLKFNTGSNETLYSSHDLYVCAPASSSSSISSYVDYNNSKFSTTRAKFNGTSAKGSSYTITITNLIKLCLNTNNPWVVLVGNYTGGGWATLSSITIEYTENYTACGAPTSITFTSIVKPGGSLKIEWSGAGGGTNNSITGYDVYYKIGGAPTTSSYDGKASITSTSTGTSKTFTISSSATRGAKFYAMVRTKGSAGSSYYSDWKSGNGGKVNSLPGAPTVSVDKTRFKSTSTSSNQDKRKFTVTPGSDSDGLSKTVRYATSSLNPPTTSNTTEITSGTELKLYLLTTYYFWTYDGLEFSSSYTSKTITKNTAPTITSVTMGAYNNTTYLPSTRDGYVKNINGSAVVTKDSAATLSYKWYLCVGSSASATTYGTETLISTATSLSNIDVTAYGATFNTAYKLKLVITDDLGETANAISSTVYAIPAAPTPTIVNINNTKKLTGIYNNKYFGRYIRVNYSKNTGITKKLQYSTSDSFPTSSTSNITLSGNTDSDVDLNALTRNTLYYFRVVYVLNSKTLNNSSVYLTRAADITPNSIDITKNGTGSYIKPYTHENFSVSFGNSPASESWGKDNVYCISSNYSDIYNIIINKDSRSLGMTSTLYSHSDTDVVSTVYLNDKKIKDWSKFIFDNEGTAPTGTASLTLNVIATNLFGETFTSNSKTFTVDFRENPIFNSLPILLIKMTDGTYATIIKPADYSYYPLFATLIIGYTCAKNSIYSYVNQPATLNFYKGTTLLARGTISKEDWGYDEALNRYKLNAIKNIEYKIPTITSGGQVSYKLEIVYDNFTNNKATSDINNLCGYTKINTSEVALNIESVDETSLVLKYKYTNNGNSTSSDNAYSNQMIKFTYDTTPSGSYDGTFLTKNNAVVSSDLKEITGTISSNNDIIYFGATVTLTANFIDIGSKTPVGTKTYTKKFTNKYVLYRATPNLGYGKNFFFLNQNAPVSGRTDLLLEISTVLYKNNNNTITRNKIYFGVDGSNLEITDNGLIIDCGSW